MSLRLQGTVTREKSSLQRQQKLFVSFYATTCPKQKPTFQSFTASQSTTTVN